MADAPKPFHIIVLSVFGVAAVVGLFIFANFSGGGQGKAEVGTVVIWGTLPKTPIENAIAELSGADDRFADVQYVEKSASGFGNALADALASGTGPDLVIITQEMLAAERSKLSYIPYESLPQRTFLDTYVPLFELFLGAQGTYGIPLAVDPMVLYYNRAILSSAAVAAPPSTWEAVSGFASAVTRRDERGAIGRSAIALGEYGNVRNARGILSLMLLQSGSSITETTINGTRATLADDTDADGGATPAESAVNYYAQYADPAKTVYSWNRSLPDSRQVFLSGELALYLGFASELSFLSSANPNLDFDMVKAPMPGTARNRITYGVGYAFAVPRAAPNPSGGMQAAFALGSSTYAPRIAAGLGLAPAHRSALGSSASDPYRAIYYPEALVAEGWISPSPAQTDQVFSAMIADITSGRAGVDEALSGAAQSIDAALR